MRSSLWSADVARPQTEASGSTERASLRQGRNPLGILDYIGTSERLLCSPIRVAIQDEPGTGRLSTDTGLPTHPNLANFPRLNVSPTTLQ